MAFDNLIRLDDQPINEESSAFLNVTFKDENGNDVDPTTAEYTLYAMDDGSVINSRSKVTVPGSGASRTIELTPDDNVILDDSLDREEHRVYISFTYAGTKKGSREIQILVLNMAKES